MARSSGRRPAASRRRQASAPPTGSNKRARGGATAAANAVAAINAREARKRKIKQMIRFGIILGMVLAVLGGSITLLTNHIADQISLQQPEDRSSISITAEDGTIITDFVGLVSRPVSAKDLPKEVQGAFLAAHDPYFESHMGIGFSDLTRLVYPEHAPSTITVRLARDLFEKRQVGSLRALEEAVLALWLEIKFSKPRIMEEFLQRSYFGDGVYGLEQAALQFFSTRPKDLGVKRAAVLAAALDDPDRFNPLANPKQANERANQIIDVMIKTRMVKRSVGEREKRNRLRPRPAQPAGPAELYLGMAAMERTADLIGFPVEHMRVKTTIDLSMQRKADYHLETFLSRVGAKRNIGNAALIVMKPTGEILAFSAGTRYEAMGRNRVTEQGRQSGALFSIYPYLVAMDHGLSSTEWVRDNPVVVDGWRARNLSGKHYGQITAKDAFARGLLTVPATFAQQYGAASIIQRARQLGISSPLKQRAQVVAGLDKVTMLELVKAYTVLATGGFDVTPHLVTEIRGRSGQSLYQAPALGKNRVMPPDRAIQINQLLATAMTKGIGQGGRLDRQAAGLAATTPGHRDAWFMGFTADLVAAVWLGNDNGKAMDKVSGRREAAQFWRSFMLDAHEEFPIRTIQKGIQAHTRAIHKAANSS